MCTSEFPASAMMPKFKLLANCKAMLRGLKCRCSDETRSDDSDDSDHDKGKR